MITIPEPWITPPDMKEKIHLLYQKSEFVEKSMQRFSGRWTWGKMGGTYSLPTCIPESPCFPSPPPKAFMTCLQLLPDLFLAGGPNSTSLSSLSFLEIMRSEMETFSGEYGGSGVH
jgi:hypothetical protein